MEKQYRKSVAAVFLNEKGEVLLFQRRDYPDSYQFPQGGIEEGEEPIKTLERELLEETNIQNYEIIERTEPYCYDKEFSRDGKDYLGQCHYYFFCKLKGNFDFKPSNEFISYKWVKKEEAAELFPPFKRETIKKILALI